MAIIFSLKGLQKQFEICWSSFIRLIKNKRLTILSKFKFNLITNANEILNRLEIANKIATETKNPLIKNIWVPMIE